jgi:peptidyl-prolyl cis-trans isomerase SurA
MVVASIGDSDITLGEYEDLYLKTSTNREDAAGLTLEEREKFLGLLTNFRLKLMDAYNSGLDRDPAIQSEMNLYKGSLASSFLVEREVMRPGVRKLYDERQTEYRASHILLNLPESTDPADTAAVEKKAYELIARLKAGESIDSLAVQFSQDPSAKQNMGDLYYFTSGQMVRPFEEAVIGMKVGEVLDHPVRSQYGLHIIKLLDRKPAPGEIRCSHLMARFTSPTPSPEDTLKAYQKLQGLLDSLRLGTPFAELAKRHSEDPGSAPNGGDLGWFGRRRWVQEFDEEAFKLKPGQTSGIIRSRYGYHLIHCTDTRLPKTFEESENDIQKLYEQVRFNEDKQNYVRKLKKETGFSLDQTVLKRFISELDTNSTMKNAAWADSLTPATRQAPLMRFGNRTISVDSVVTVLKQRPDLQTTSLRPGSFGGTIDKVAEQFVFMVKSETIDKQYPEFASLMKEYMDGILLYQVEQQKIWGSMTVTDSASRAYFEKNREKFMFPDRVEFTEIRAASDSAAQSFYTRVMNGSTFRQIVVEDSTRMARKNNHMLPFAKKSSRLSGETLDALSRIAADLEADPKLRLHLIAHPDTVAGKSAAASLATKRLDRARNHLINQFGIQETRISTFVRPVLPGVTDKAERSRLNERLDADLVGRTKAVVGNIEHVLSAVDADERSKQANLLQAGEVSKPFRFKNGYSLVMLVGKEPARNKTYEEAGTEVSSAFQEYESKRLEQEWLDGLRKQYPVTTDREVLERAFLSSE